MKREEKNALSRQRILNAAMVEFSAHGYDGASVNTICSKNEISKGILYHYFKDKDELYLFCVEKCFEAVTDSLSETASGLTGSAERRLSDYFDARLRFFAENSLYLGIFASAAYSPPTTLSPQIAKLRQKFDDLNISVLTGLLQSEPLHNGLSIETVVRDFSLYMDYFNLHFRSEPTAQKSFDELLKEHEERCHRQLHILLYGVLEQKR